MAEKQALALRDLAAIVAKAKGVLITEANTPDLYSYRDPRIRIEYSGGGKPQVLDVFRRGDLDLKVLSVIWAGDDAVVVIHRTGSWEVSLRCGWRKRAVKPHPICAATTAADNLTGSDSCCGRRYVRRRYWSR
jgi:hypothetical protein